MQENKVEILVLDFGSQYTQLIARRLREYGVYTEIVPYFESIANIKAKNPKGLILSGGPASVYEKDAYKPDSKIFELGIPVLGICYGMQFIAHHFGGSVIEAKEQEFGKAILEILNLEQSVTFSGFTHKKDEQTFRALLDLWEDSAKSCDLKEVGILNTKEEVRRHLEKSQSVIATTDSSDFLGFIGVSGACIEMLFVHPKFLRRGVGSALLREAYLRELYRFSRIQARVCEKNARGIAFYKSLGFKEISKDNALITLEADCKELECALKTHNLLFNNVKQDSIVWMSHADKVESLPSGFVSLAKSGNTTNCAIADVKRKIYALQFHPEVVHSECGAQILENFALKICKTRNDWNMKNFVDLEAGKIAQIVQNSKVLCAVSGGVDSSVVATLLYKAIGENVIPIFVDTGLLRLGEKEAVEKMFRENLKVPLITIDASDEFLRLLKGVTDPEKKRKIIGETFIKVFEREAKKHNQNGEIKFLAQGTLYPDVIESVSVKGPSKTIKSHHNVGGLPEWMKFELIEPLRELFKDEVRALGRELKMPEFMLMRHPFPGPGLAIRIMGEVNRADLDLLRRADFVFIDELRRSGLYDSVWQAFCVLLNVKSVGVMGDNRTYDNTICVRCVNAMDGMTASFSHLPHDFLERVSNRIINEVKGINRVVYDITSKPPGTIEWE